MLEGLFSNIGVLIRTVVIVVLVFGGVFIINKQTKKKYDEIPGMEFRRQMIMLSIFFVALILILVGLPITPTLRGQLLSLIGILLSAAIALSATTFVGNIMAGIMLRTIEGVRIGDFIRMNDHFGRITEMDMLHVEIQTEDRNLTTLPNMALVTNPVSVLRKSGTIIGIEIGLGYDTHRLVIEKHLLEAAVNCELKDPFVQIKTLGDFTVTYRIAGVLEDLSTYIASHSRLKRNVLDQLHDNGIEIMSPAFINTKSLSTRTKAIPKRPSQKEAPEVEGVSPDNISFDKAESAELHDDYRKRLADVRDGIKEVDEQLAKLGADEDSSHLSNKKSELIENEVQLVNYISKLEVRLTE